MKPALGLLTILLASPSLSQAASPRIIGGADASIEDYPWQVALISNVNDLYDSQSCGGSLVDEQWVLTAAHCVTEEDGNGNPVLAATPTHVVVGITNLSDGSQAQIIPVDSITFHPSYEPASFNNDLALIKLANPVDMTSCGARCAIIPLISAANEDDLMDVGTAAFISGWGNQSNTGASNFPVQLQAAQVSIMDCVGSGSGYSVSDITNNMICAGIPSTFTKDTCQGDSGGPIVVSKGNDGYIQVGIVSFGEGCAMANYPGVYTRISRYSTWLRTTSGGDVVASTEGNASGGGGNSGSSSGGGGGSLGWLSVALLGLGFARRRSA